MDSDTLSTNLLKVFCSFAKELTTSFPETSEITKRFKSIISSCLINDPFSRLTSEKLVTESWNLLKKLQLPLDSDWHPNMIILNTTVKLNLPFPSLINEKTNISLCV